MAQFCGLRHVSAPERPEPLDRTGQPEDAAIRGLDVMVNLNNDQLKYGFLADMRNCIHL